MRMPFEGKTHIDTPMLVIECYATIAAPLMFAAPLGGKRRVA